MRFGPKLAASILLLCLCGCKSDPVSEAAILQQEVYSDSLLDYLLFMPKHTSAVLNGKFPLLLSLHGIGERGSDLQLLKRDGLARRLDGYNTFPFIVVSPQCPLSTEWYYNRTDTLLDQLLDDVLARYPVDPARVYVTGYSMGGIGAWDMAIRHPQRFAAAIPIASRGESYATICDMRDIPVWAFHGANDDVVALVRAEAIVKALRDCGGEVRLTVYPDTGHDSWTKTYNNPQIYEWLLAQHR